MSTVLQVTGMAIVVAGVALISVPAAVITGGILTVIIGLAVVK